MGIFSFLAELVTSAAMMLGGDNVAEQLDAFSLVQENGYLQRFASEADAIESGRIKGLQLQLGISDASVFVSRRLTGLDGFVANGQIVLSADLLLEDDETVAFVLAHEYAHMAFEHRKVANLHMQAFMAEAGLKSATQKSLREMRRPASYYEVMRSNEFAADAFAKHLLVKSGLWTSGHAAKRVLEDAPASATHPSSKARYHALGID